MTRRVESGVRRPGGRADRQQHVADAAAQARHGGAAGGEQGGGALGGSGGGTAGGPGSGGGPGTAGGRGCVEDGEGAEVHGVGGGFDPPEGEVERRQVLGGHKGPLADDGRSAVA